MNRQEKEQVVSQLKNDLEQSKASFLVNFHGLSVAQMQQLRRDIRSQQGRLSVAKARLMRIAMRGNADFVLFDPFLKDQVALVVADDSPSIAKVLYEFAKESKLKLVAGFSESHFLDAQAIVKIASLPSKEVLLAQLGGLFQAPLVRLAQNMNQLLAKPVYAFKQLEEKKRAENV